MRFVHLIRSGAIVLPSLLVAGLQPANADDAAGAIARAIITGIVIAPDGKTRFEGVGPPNSVIAVSSGPARLGQTNVSPAGTWRLDAGAVLNGGDHAIAAATLGADAAISTAPVRVSIPNGFAGPLTIPRDERRHEPARRDDDANVNARFDDAPVTASGRANAEALAAAATGMFSEVLRRGDYRQFAQAETRPPNTPTSPPPPRPSAVPADDFLAPVIGWLERSARTYQEVIVRRLSEGDEQSHPVELPRPPAREAEQQPRVTGSQIIDEALDQVSRATDTARFSVQEWLARANRTYQHEIVRPLSQPDVGPRPEVAAHQPPAPAPAPMPMPEPPHVAAPKKAAPPAVAVPSPQPSPPASPAPASPAEDDPATKAAEHARRIADAAHLEEQRSAEIISRKAAETARRLEEAHMADVKAAEARRVEEQQRLARDKAAAEATRKANEARLAEIANKAKIATAEALKQQHAALRDEERRAAQARHAEEQRQAQEAAAQSAHEAAEEALREAEHRQAMEQAEATRQANEARVTEALRKAGEAKLAEQQRLAELKQQEEIRRAEARRQDDLRLAREREKAATEEAARKTAEAQRETERKHAAEQERKRIASAADAARKAREAKLDEDARNEAARKAREAEVAEQQRRLAAQMEQEAARLAEDARISAQSLAARPTRAERNIENEHAARMDKGTERKNKLAQAAPERTTPKQPAAKAPPKQTAAPARTAPARKAETPKPQRKHHAARVRQNRPHHATQARAKPGKRHHAKQASAKRWASAKRGSHRHHRSKISTRRAALRGRASALYIVRRGDTLSKIARRYYRDARKYPVIFAANRKRLRHPDFIRRGQVLVLPKARR